LIFNSKVLLFTISLVSPGTKSYSLESPIVSGFRAAYCRQRQTNILSFGGMASMIDIACDRCVTHATLTPAMVLDLVHGLRSESFGIKVVGFVHRKESR
jgi:hypothetical protein